MLKAGSPPAELAVDVFVVGDASVFRNPWNENKAGDLFTSPPPTLQITIAITANSPIAVNPSTA